MPLITKVTDLRVFGLYLFVFVELNLDELLKLVGSLLKGVDTLLHL